MLAQLSRPAVAHAPPIQGADTFAGETSPWRVALVAPPGLFRDGFARLIATCVAEIRLECHDSVEDVVPGPARLGLLAFDPSACGREALSARIEALRARCGGAPIGVVIPGRSRSRRRRLSARLASLASFRSPRARRSRLRRCV